MCIYICILYIFDYYIIIIVFLLLQRVSRLSSVHDPLVVATTYPAINLGPAALFSLQIGQVGF